MKFVLDTHSHTIASAHAYSTVLESAKAAAEKGLRLLAITDHGPALQDSSHELHFMGYHVLDKSLFGVEMLYGAELNIMDYEGSVDLPENITKKLDLCIASFHPFCTAPGDVKQNTRAYLNAMNHPHVDIIGHPNDGKVPVDYEELVRGAKQSKVLLEVNNSTLKAVDYRLGTKENLITMLRLCEKYQVYVSLGTDAHFANAVGDFGRAQSLFDEIRFPEELVVNTSVEKFKEHLYKRKGGL